MSAIAQTAPLTLITGTPGSGKTLRAVWYITQAIKAGDQVFACNINGLNVPGVMPFDDPWKWEELPAGSVLVVDEAQKYWRAGVTENVFDNDAGKMKASVPLNVQAMETMRHVGVRIIMLTQSPTLIHTNVRQLVGLHEHLVRQDGKAMVTIYRRSSCIDNVRSERALRSEDHQAWAYPKECFDLYKSAEVHTVKRTLSSKTKRGIGIALLAIALIGYAIWNGKQTFAPGEKPQAQQGAAVAQATAAPAESKASQGEVKYANRDEYLAAHQPREPAMPWSAQVFDQRGTLSDPQVFCMSSVAGEGADGQSLDYSCTCLTEQGTRYVVDVALCRTIARHGTDYNPYKERRDMQMQPAMQAAQPATTTQPTTITVPNASNSSRTLPESPGYKCETCGS